MNFDLNHLQTGKIELAEKKFGFLCQKALSQIHLSRFWQKYHLLGGMKFATQISPLLNLDISTFFFLEMDQAPLWKFESLPVVGS